MEMIEVRCCCNPSNLMGHVPLDPGLGARLQLHELSDGGVAFSGEDRSLAGLKAIPGFVQAEAPSMGRKTWKKTWKK